MVQIVEFRLSRYGRGFHLITDEVFFHLKESMPDTGFLHLTLQHTSAGLTLNENADPSVRVDFEAFINQIIPENHPLYTHILEGSDDMPAHIKSSLIGATVSFPIQNGMFRLGTWQGIYLCEFRNFGGVRSIAATIIS